MNQLRRMRLFVRTVETESFSRAGKAESVAQSTVSKEVAALEAHLGTLLIRRSSRGLSVTDKGQEFYDFAVGMLGDLETAEARIRSGEVTAAGRLRVTCSPVFSNRLIAPRLPALFQRYPDLTIDLEVSERYVSLIEDGVDVAIRIGELPDSSLLARQIGCVEAVVVAAPAYLAEHGTPTDLDELASHSCLPFTFQGNSKTWKFQGPDGPIVVTPFGPLRTNDPESVHAAVLAGMGLAQGPSWMFASDIAAGRLVSVLEDFRPRLYPIQAVSSTTRRMTGAIKVFVDFVASLLKDERNRPLCTAFRLAPADV
ncbi:MAG TPA: LysR family transcriptional regulator [Pelagibacterium sp.]|uniref:LysR family transcriptional regulator n=1 Tax=uncultured Pelagibacterium sp. TaxID=1159875 RepID=UPI000C66F2D2|nr:LysR family transcriptional regulator [Pelagibacterium sp.]HCO54829.1 LysR family transcriptional regulator [Pelagibacterium sp.]|tara:strand:+ start:9641 stop:10576 length:936 start_codon:yes stop_codon:yes gene_type:complete